jgi:hypothetical protein
MTKPERKNVLPALVKEIDLTAFEKAKEEKHKDWRTL